MDEDIPNKDFEALRQEHASLSALITRFALIRFTVLFFVVLTLSHASEQINKAEVTQKQTEVSNLSMEIGEPTPSLDPFPDPLGFRFNPFSEEDISGELGESVPSLNRFPDPLGFRHSRFSEEKGLNNQSIWSSVTEANDSPVASEAEPQNKEEARKQKREELNKKSSELMQLFDKAFIAKLSLLGVDAEFDLRDWLYSLPFLFILTQVYLSILRSKQKALNILGTSVLSQQAATERLTMNRMLFSDEGKEASSYSRHPSQGENFIITTVTIIVGLYFVWVGKPFWENWTKWALLTALLVLGAATFEPYNLSCLC